MAARKSPHHIPERFLRQLWKHQQFRTTNISTIDGRAVEILFPGTFNRDGGPDFINARLRIDGILYRGNVELHQRLEEWTQHLHHRDPKYNSVILHVVLRGPARAGAHFTQSNRPLPVLVLERYLSAPYSSAWKSMILHERAERLEAIRCADANESADTSIIRRWIEKLALERIEIKIRRFEERLRELVDEQRLAVKEPAPYYDEIPFGLNPDELPSPMSALSPRHYAPLEIWEQLLYEGAMEALGYSKNQRPFLRMARALPLVFLRGLIGGKLSDTENVLQLEAALFGVAGLLPLIKDLHDMESKQRVRSLRGRWKQMRKLYLREILNAGEWQFFRLHPENFPSRRLAGAGRLIVEFLRENYFTSIIHIMKRKNHSGSENHRSLEELFIIPSDEFWTWHFRFGERASSLVGTLIGKNRANNIIVNTIIPVCLLYARIFRNRIVRETALNLYRSCPPESENSVTRTMERQLIKGRFRLDSAMLHQGTIQLNRSYCSEGRCGECAIGKTLFHDGHQPPSTGSVR